MSGALDREAIERMLQVHDVGLVRFETPDLNGVSRGKSVTADHFWGFVESGLALVSDIFCWDHHCWLATGTGFGEDMTFADLVMRPDLATFRVLPHAPGQARVICDIEYSDGRPVEASPRRVMHRRSVAPTSQPRSRTSGSPCYRRWCATCALSDCARAPSTKSGGRPSTS